MSRIWAKLTRTGGSEESLAVPSVLNLSDAESFFGRFSQPAAKSDNPFTHTTQHVIACLFVSSTHFAIFREDTTAQSRYFIRDYSRNGTFLNAALVGTNERKELFDNDKISLRYKDKDKIIYQFNLLPSESSAVEGAQVVPSQVSNIGNDGGEPTTTSSSSKRNNNKDSSHFPLKKADSTSEIFTQQITNLQTEIKRLENKLSLTNDQIELITKENEKLIRKSRQDEKLLQQNKIEIDDLKERLQASETNATALEARNRVLQENIEDITSECKEMKNKNHFYHNELQEKNQLVENHRQVVDDLNKAISNEKRLRNGLEGNLQEMKNKLQIYEEKHLRLSNANQALQGIVDDLEQSNQQLQVSQALLYLMRISTLKFVRKVYMKRYNSLNKFKLYQKFKKNSLIRLLKPLIRCFL